MRSVAVFGGTGFLGRAVVHQLVAADVKVRVAVRHPEPINLSDGTARSEHLSSVCADVADEKSVGRALEGCDAAVNVVGYTSSVGLTRLGPSTNSARRMWRGSRHVRKANCKLESDTLAKHEVRLDAAKIVLKACTSAES